MKKLTEQEIAERYRKRIRHNYSPEFYDTAARLLTEKKILFLGKSVRELLFDNITVKGVENVEEVKDKQLFYVSNHISLADFLVQGCIFWEYDLPIPRFVAGENLFHFPFNIFWKKCGAISLNRKGNRIYKETFKEEIEKYLLEGENLLLYPEGGRNYSGDEVKKFKTGLLGILIDVVEKGRDIYLVPIKGSYDRRIEERFLHKVQRNKEKRDTCLKNGKKTKAKIYDNFYFWWDVLAYFARTFDREKGNAYLNFGKSFPVRDFLNESEKQRKVALAEDIRSRIIEL